MYKKKSSLIVFLIILSINIPLIYSATDEGYGEANDNLGQFTDTFENTDNITVMDDVIRNSTLNCIELNVTEGFETMVYSPLQIREHKHWSAYDPVMTFSLSTYVAITSSSTGLGKGYMFFTVNRAWINGKYFRWRWKHAGYGSATTRIYDGDYDRSSLVDFPNGAPLLIKGNGLLQTLDTCPYNVIKTSDVLVDVSGGTLDNVTIFIILSDAWSSQLLITYLYWFQVNDGIGGANNVMGWNMATAGTTFTYENTATVYDYARVDGGDVEDFEVGGYEFQGYFITDDYLNYTTGNSLSLLTNASIPEGTLMTVQFSNDNVTWVDNEGNAGSTSIVDGFYAIDLRNLNYTDDYKMVNFTGTPSLTPRLYQLREITTEGLGNGISDDYAGLLIIGLILGLILGIGVSRS